MWMESVLGVCLGCKIHALLVRRGWASADPAFEICAHGECRARVMSALLERQAPSGPAQAEAAFLAANPCLPDAPRRAPRHRVRPARRHRQRLPRLHRRQPVRRVADRGARRGCCATASTATRTPPTRPRRPRPRLVEQPRAAVLRLLQRARERVRVHLHAERHRRDPARGRGVPVRAVPRHVRQPQLGQRHPRVRPREGSRDRRTCRSRRPISAWPGSPITSTRPTAPASSPIPRSPTSRASSIRWSGSTWPMSGAGTCSWTAPRSRRRAGSTCRCGSRTSSRCRSTRCSATRRAWAR